MTGWFLGRWDQNSYADKWPSVDRAGATTFVNSTDIFVLYAADTVNPAWEVKTQQR